MAKAKKGGLGKGVDALFFDNAVEENAVKLSVDEIEPNREQPRKTFDEEALAEQEEEALRTFRLAMRQSLRASVISLPLIFHSIDG